MMERVVAFVSSVLLVLVMARPSTAQSAASPSVRAFAVGIALGTTVPNGYALNMPGDIGIHARVDGVWARSPSLAVRGELAAGMLSGAGAEPSCVPGTSCRGYALHPDQTYSATAALEVRPFAAAPRLFGVLGGGVYYARGPEATDFGATAGALGGVGVDLMRGHRGFAIEATYHHLFDRFGTLTGMLMPSLGYRF